MYTQQYDRETAKISVPNNYSGNALLETFDSKKEKDTSDKNQSFIEPGEMRAEEESEVMAKPKDKPFFSSVFKNLPFGNLLGGFDFFKNGKIKLGSEEIIIAAVALFLIFTSDGDTELGIMLLLLLFIT